MLTGYCAGWSLKQLIKEGLGGITGKITSALILGCALAEATAIYGLVIGLMIIIMMG